MEQEKNGNYIAVGHFTLRGERRQDPQRSPTKRKVNVFKQEVVASFKKKDNKCLS